MHTGKVTIASVAESVAWQAQRAAVDAETMIAMSQEAWQCAIDPDKSAWR